MYRQPTRDRQGDSERASLRSSRPGSVSSDHQSILSPSSIASLLVPAPREPPPAYVAVAAASQIVTDHQNAKVIDELGPTADAVPAESARVSEEALSLLNSFLDALIYSVLGMARSPSITAMRPAILDVLKPRLAREAMSTADDELSGLLAGDEDEEFPEGQDGAEFRLDAVFTRTRLRIMVYTRLGELEDEDEERFLAEDQDTTGDLGRGPPRERNLVSWAAAIFLTSVVEYIAEQTLVVAGQAAFTRVRSKRKRSNAGNADEAAIERVIVHEHDMEKVALNSALGRLWRTWKKALRSHNTPLASPGSGRSSSHSSLFQSFHGYRRYSTGNAQDAPGATALTEETEKAQPDSTAGATIKEQDGDEKHRETDLPESGAAKKFLEDADREGQKRSAVLTRPTSWLFTPGRGQSASLLRSRCSSMPSLRLKAIEKEALAKAQEKQPAPETADSSPSPFVTPAESASDSQDQVASDRKQVSKEGKEKERRRRHSVKPAPLHISTYSTLQASFPSPPVGTPRSLFRDQSPIKGSEGGTAAMEPNGSAKGLSSRSSRSNVSDGKDRSGKSTTVSEKKALDCRTENGPDRNIFFDAPEQSKSHLRNGSADSQIIGLAKTSDVALAAPPSPLPPSGEMEEPAQKENLNDKQHVSSLPMGNVSEGKVMTNVVDAGPAPSKQPGECLREGSSGTQMATARPATSSTPGFQNSPKPPSLSGTSSHTRESAPRKSQDSSRSRNRVPSGSDQGVERAGLQRVSSVSSSGTSTYHQSRGSESSIVFGRQRGKPTRLSDDDRTREFDAQIAQADTVYYTLTPERMREVSAKPAAERATAEAQTQAGIATAPAKVTVFPRIIDQKPPWIPGRSNSSVASSKKGSVSLPGRRASDDNEKEAKTRRPLPVNEGAKVFSRLKQLPREPRVQTDPTFDLRDFLMSTTPSGPRMKPIDTTISNRSVSDTTSRTPTSTTGNIFSKSIKSSANGSGPASPFSRESKSRESKDSMPPRSSHKKTNLEPRNAAGPSHIDNDLIDLIRQGPPGPSGEHRIPRAVAPFRSTMDSDQFEMYASTGPSLSDSHQTSDSRSVLLPPIPTSQLAFSGEPLSLLGEFSDPEPGPAIKPDRPKKKLDPYAIPDDNDEEFVEDDTDITALSSHGTPKRPAQSEEQSLADFLASEPPPQHMTDNTKTEPFFLSNDTLSAIRSGNAATPASANGKRNQRHYQHQATLSQTQSLNPPPSSSYSTQTVATNFSTLNNLSRLNSNGTAVSGGSPLRRPPTSATTATKRSQHPPRDARLVDDDRGVLTEMADFLRFSGPPPKNKADAADSKPMPFVKMGRDGALIEVGPVSAGELGGDMRDADEGSMSGSKEGGPVKQSKWGRGRFWRKGSSASAGTAAAAAASAGH
ncbi:hypothetical protein BKA81DRAFT_195569 [Phyllosticta paracitricarpa]